jgi:hypothetical protein
VEPGRDDDLEHPAREARHEACKDGLGGMAGKRDDGKGRGEHKTQGRLLRG